MLPREPRMGWPFIRAQGAEMPSEYYPRCLIIAVFGFKEAADTWKKRCRRLWLPGSGRVGSGRAALLVEYRKSVGIRGEALRSRTGHGISILQTQWNRIRRIRSLVPGFRRPAEREKHLTRRAHPIFSPGY
jgi:hypothetical protein